ncbi:arginase family protein [Streptomyces sp. NPDC015242]|uniref:arginase family protein n=1 Tax=Streptomyces sp. NPDC015242 TaxID=3364951 RepID=UPI0036FEEA85
MEHIGNDSTGRYAQNPTFLGIPYQSAPRGRDVVVIGAPYDAGTTHRPGTQLGPRAIRQGSDLLLSTGFGRGAIASDFLDCADAGDIDLAAGGAHIVMEVAQRSLQALLEHNDAFLMLGGDHALTLAALRAVARKHGRIAAVHLDAHCDTQPALYGNAYHHGTAFRLAVEERLIDPRRLVQIGVRGHRVEPGPQDEARSHGTRVISAAEVSAAGPSATARVIRDIVGDVPVYVSVGMDVVDPRFAPGTGTPAPDGPSSLDVLEVLRCVGDLEPVGLDVMGVCPPYDHGGITSLLATEVGAELLYQFARSRCG